MLTQHICRVQGFFLLRESLLLLNELRTDFHICTIYEKF